MKEAFELAEKLKPRLRSAFQQQLLAASLQSAAHVGNPLRLNNFSASFRELFRHVFLALAPDQQVESCCWFKPDPTARGRATRAQKVSFVVHGGLDPNYVQDELGINVEQERAALLRTIDRLSKFTHVNQQSFGSPTDVVERQVLEACRAIASFLDCADEARTLLCERVEARVHDNVVGEAISETILSIEEIATHHSVEHIEVEQIHVTAIDHEDIEFTAYGYLEVELQWGSNSDVRRGDGAVMRDSYPLTCKFVSKVSDPEEIAVVEDSLRVDTSTWWDGYYDEAGP